MKNHVAKSRKTVILYPGEEDKSLEVENTLMDNKQRRN